MITLDLPFPPSANSIWRAVNGRNIVSKGYRAWKLHAGQMLMAQKRPRIDPPVEVEILLVAPTKRPSDADNRIKPVLDALKDMRIIADDDSRYVRKVSAEWVKSGPPCRVTIRPITPAQEDVA